MNISLVDGAAAPMPTSTHYAICPKATSPVGYGTQALHPCCSKTVVVAAVIIRPHNREK